MSDQPLIYTTKGNLPVSDLRYETVWTETSEYVTLNENYYLGDELVKSSAHVYARKPFDATQSVSQSLV